MDPFRNEVRNGRILSRNSAAENNRALPGKA
jgi:hypothetical protein